MVIDMNETRLCTLGQIQAFLEGTGEVGFQPIGGDEGRYGHIQAVLKRFAYPELKRADKGLVLRYLGRTTSYSRQQLTRLVRQCLPTGRLAKRYRPPIQGFAHKYTAADVALLAEADAGYRARRQHWAKTRPTGIPIGERRAPRPDGCPGYLRIDSVHPGDEDSVKGVYHINVVDCVTQWEVVATCERLSEAYLLPSEGVPAFGRWWRRRESKRRPPDHPPSTWGTSIRPRATACSATAPHVTDHAAPIDEEADARPRPLVAVEPPALQGLPVGVHGHGKAELVVLDIAAHGLDIERLGVLVIGPEVFDEEYRGRGLVVISVYQTSRHGWSRRGRALEL